MMEFLLFENNSSSSSSSSDSVSASIIITSEMLRDKCKNENYVEETVPQYSERQFMEHFRISRKILEKLKTDFEQSDFYPKSDTGFARISSEKCILAFLWYASNEAISFRDVADRFNLSISTLHGIINKVARFLSNISENNIVWPSSDECKYISEEFKQMGFPGAIGCIDGTHIRIDAPNDDAESYLNRKKYYSIQMQVVCDNNKKIRDVFIGYPGSVHDARVFRNSPLCEQLRDKCKDWVILGDSAYPCLRNLLTPYKDFANLTNAQKNYNKKLSHCRVLIEHTIGLLKQRFRQLYHMKSKNIEFICHFIRACCVLHNMCINDATDENVINPDNYIDRQNDEPVENIQDNENNAVGLNYRNYVAAMLSI